MVSSTSPALAFAREPLGNWKTTLALLYVGGSVLLQVSQATMLMATVSLPKSTSTFWGYTLSPDGNRWVVCSFPNFFIPKPMPFDSSVLGECTVPPSYLVERMLLSE